ncbi:MAG: MetQ/NlpA family ABC transporter substrate-binding protein [Synergistaceae bacterium]|jgi:D-methionine transport system substrate-binding protein|nr:MetQ/NlpA family ABC transporter substrate-binding protein [Synergistaceae bacterium]
MKKRFYSILPAILVFIFAFAAFGAPTYSEAADRVTVKIGITGEMYNDLWGPAIKSLANDGIDVELVSFSDYTLPNAALAAKEIDLNTFQHYNYLNNEIKTKDYKITAIGDTLLAALCVYSKTISNLNELKAGDKIAIPGDAVNTGRALTVIQGAGLIKLDASKGNLPEVTDITENPLELQFVQVDAAQVPSLLPDVAAGVINGGYAVDFGLSPEKDSIFYDDLSFYKDKGYVNIIAARTEDIDNPVYKKVVAAIQSDATAQVMKEKFEGAFIPAW